MLMFRKKQEKNQNTFQQSNPSAKVKGGIHISNSGEHGLETALTLIIAELEHIKEKVDKIDKHTNQNHAETKKIKKGLLFYIQNNGVSKEVKVAAKAILD